MAEEKKQVSFTCPRCNDHQLESVEKDVTARSPITALNDNGDFDYDTPILEDGEVVLFQCVHCGFILADDEGIGFLKEHDEVIEWCKRHCEQEDG